jgi:hypothetical protein
LKVGFDDQPLAAFGAAARGFDLQGQQALVAGFRIVLSVLVEGVARERS